MSNFTYSSLLCGSESWAKGAAAVGIAATEVKFVKRTAVCVGLYTRAHTHTHTHARARGKIIEQ